jgi:hypothetical protein
MNESAPSSASRSLKKSAPRKKFKTNWRQQEAESVLTVWTGCTKGPQADKQELQRRWRDISWGNDVSMDCSRVQTTRSWRNRQPRIASWPCNMRILYEILLRRLERIQC